MALGNEEQSDAPSALLFPNRRGLLKTLGVGAAGVAGIGSAGSVGGQETTTQEPERQVQGDYVVGDATDAETLNFIQISDVPSANRVGLTLDGAYALTPPPESAVFPLWADISTEDKQTYTVELRDGLQWGGDYGQMTADDWVYMIQKVFEAEDNWAGFTNQSDWMRNGEFIPVEQTGDLTFDIKLPEVDPAFPQKPVMWGAFAMPRGILEKYVPDKNVEGLQQDEDVQTLAYSGNLGPYNFERWNREAEFVATRNDDYYMQNVDDIPEKYNPSAWQGAPYFESFTYQVIPEESTRLSALRAGEITQTGVPEPKVKGFQDNSDVNVNIAPQPFNTLLIYNRRMNGWKPFRKTEVRNALAFAVNKKAIVDNILRGFATVAHTFQPQFSKWYDDSQVVQTGVGDSYNPERARNMLESALGDTEYGYDGDTVVGPNGDQLSLKLVYPVGTQTTETAVQFIAQEYGNVGINVELEGVQFNTLLSKYAQNSYQGEGEPEFNAGPFNSGPRDKTASQEQWDMQYGIIFNTFPRTPSSTRSFWIRDESTNYYGYVPEADLASLYDEASQETDEQRRQEIYAEIFGVLSEEQANGFMNMGSSIAGFRARLAFEGGEEIAVSGDLGPDEVFGYAWDSNTWFFRQA